MDLPRDRPLNQLLHNHTITAARLHSTYSHRPSFLKISLRYLYRQLCEHSHIFAHYGLTIKDYEIMAQFTGTQWINKKLVAADKPKLEKFIASYGSNADTVLVEMAAEAFSVKIMFYDKQVAYGVMLMPTKDNKTHQGLVLTAYSDSPLEALFMAWYKHVQLFGRGVWVDDTSESWG